MRNRVGFSLGRRNYSGTCVFQVELVDNALVNTPCDRVGNSGNYTHGHKQRSPNISKHIMAVSRKRQRTRTSSILC